MARRYEPRTHLLGPITGGGFHRTLCEHDMTPCFKVTSDPELVTCAICTWRMAKVPQRAN